MVQMSSSRIAIKILLIFVVEEKYFYQFNPTLYYVFCTHLRIKKIFSRVTRERKGETHEKQFYCRQKAHERRDIRTRVAALAFFFAYSPAAANAISSRCYGERSHVNRASNRARRFCTLPTTSVHGARARRRPSTPRGIILLAAIPIRVIRERVSTLSLARCVRRTDDAIAGAILP